MQRKDWMIVLVQNYPIGTRIMKLELRATWHKITTENVWVQWLGS